MSLAPQQITNELFKERLEEEPADSEWSKAYNIF
jgi:hypothetical protein